MRMVVACALMFVLYIVLGATSAEQGGLLLPQDCADLGRSIDA